MSPRPKFVPPNRKLEFREVELPYKVMSTCPRCEKSDVDLRTVSPGMKLALQATGDGDPLPAQVCASCMEDLEKQVSYGARLRAEKQVETQNRVMLWKNRVKLIRQGRQMMQQKNYADAAVAYEKYLRILELVYDVQRGGLAPELFSNSKRSKELTVITSVYWDLLRIYDTSPRYGDRQSKVAQKLAEFIRFSSIQMDLIKKAETFLKSANQPQHVRAFLRASQVNRPRCFIATVAYGSEYHPHVLWLRDFRDDVLAHSRVGRAFILTYYRRSPAIARWLETPQAIPLRLLVKLVLGFFVGALKRTLKVPKKSPRNST